MNDVYLYHHALRGHRSVAKRAKWWIRFRLPQFAADLTRVSAVMLVIGCIQTLADHI